MNKDFRSKFPRTAKLLDGARGDVFPDYSVGVRHQGASHFAFAGCGPDSLFDLASLTKVLCTTTVTAIAEQRGVFSTDDPVKKFFPAFSDERVRFSHLLDHSSGLPAWLPLHAQFHEPNGLGSFNPRTTPQIARARYEEEIIKSWAPERFEKEAVYSDLGFLLLGWALEKATHCPLDALFQEWFVQPTKLESLQFLPTSPDVVVTEDCPWRGHVLRGEVHDDNCYVLGGVAAHAGLFGDVSDVLEAGRLWLEAYQQADATDTGRVLSGKMAKKYWTTTHLPSSTRVLGWDGISPENSSTGRFFSRKSRGHLGFTGTSLWIDPEKNLIVTLLTNRVHPSRSNEKIRLFRPLFHDTLLSEMGIG